jgi:hypothetical protein
VRLLSFLLSVVAVVGICALAAAPTRAAETTFINAGNFTAKLSGSLEFGGRPYAFSSGALRGRVSSDGVVKRMHATFGAARTDPAVDGPFQLKFQMLAAGNAFGHFFGNGAPDGAADPTGLSFLFQVPVYIKITGGPVTNAGPTVYANVGADCSIGTAAAPLQAGFVPALAELLGSLDDGHSYSQATGKTYLMATGSNVAGVQDCNGQEAALDQQLGLPGGGTLSLNLQFSPVLVTNTYCNRYHQTNSCRAARHNARS